MIKYRIKEWIRTRIIITLLKKLLSLYEYFSDTHQTVFTIILKYENDVYGGVHGFRNIEDFEREQIEKQLIKMFNSYFDECLDRWNSKK